MTDMKRMTSLLLLASLLFSCAGMSTTGGSDSGTFRGKWYSYYQRGLAYSSEAVWDGAIQDFQKAISKRPKDQRDARTYGMHLIPYFPHRELGIAYLNRNEIDRAIQELETSIEHEESAKAVFYLNKARKVFLEQQGGIIAPPVIVISSPLENEALNSFTARVTGRVTGGGYVASITVNGVPFRFDLAEKEIDFEVDIDLNGGTNRIAVMAEDLLGSPSAGTVNINIDREGPAISIYDIVADTGSSVRLTGAVSDSTGISKLLMNNSAEAVNNQGVHQFDITLDRSTMPSPFVIEAYDTLNNRTRAEIDIEKELSAFTEKPEPVLLAFAGTDTFSSDNVPPVITLKDSVDMPAVFVDKYYVEGEVADNRKVEQISVNGRDLLSKKGKKIFFSKLVKLDEGKNGIDIEAFDSSGNRAEEDFTVTRKVPEVLQVGNRMSISILPFDTKIGETAAELLAFDHLTGSFVNQKRFNVMERAKLEQVLLEQKLTTEKLTDPEYSLKVGRLMASDTILSTSVVADSRSVEFTSRVINTETSEIMEVKDVYSEDRSAVSIRQMMDGLASKVAGGFPLVEGIVIKKDNKFVYTDIGIKTGIKGDMGIIVYRRGEEIRHPLTGKYLGQDMLNLATADIEEIHEGFSKAKLSEASEDGDIRAADMVITK